MRFNWSDYNGATVESIIDIAETKFTKTSNLLESNEQSTVDYFLSLPSDKPVTQQRYIFKILSLVDNKVHVFNDESVGKLMFIKRDHYVILLDDGQTVEYPSKVIREKMIIKTFMFMTEEKYNKFRTALKMKFNTDLEPVQLTESMLTEARSNSVILVDFQPAYDNGTHDYESAINNAMQYINEKQPNVTAFFNGEDVGIEDTPQEVMWHFIENGLDEDLTHLFNFKEKSYAWLRQWMDEGVDDATIIKVIRYLVMNDLNDSRDIEDEAWLQLVGEDFQYYDDREMNIYLPDINIGTLKTLSGSLLGGGGHHECLKEMQLLMNAFNIKYKMVGDWIYG
jgi:hypothetical protein